MAETTKKVTKVVTPDEVRFSYAHVFEPSRGQNDDAEPKYSISLLIPKTAKKTIAAINRAIEAAKEEGKQKWGGKIPANLKLPLRDGDEEKPDDAAYEGMYFINASSKRKPAVVDSSLQPIIDPLEFYSGCWGHASINFYPFNVNGNRGVAVGLNNLMKKRNDESLGGAPAKAEDDFANFASEGDDDDFLG